MAYWVSYDGLTPVQIKKKHFIIGRSADADLILSNGAVSRSHAVIKTEPDGRLLLCDLASSNGTYLNGIKISKHLLKPGDIICVQPFEILFQDHSMLESTDFFTASKEYSLVGQLEKTPLMEILQGIEFNDKTGTIIIKKDTLEGTLVFAGGKPVSAKFGEKREEQAILEMLKLRSGYFMVSNQIEAVEAGIHVSFTSILLEYSRLVDEV